jgi:hypothetical protein
MEEERTKYRKKWEKSLPGTSDEWNYWWLHAEGYCIGIVPGSDLLAALDIIEDNYLKFPKITASLAKIVDGDLVRQKRDSGVVVAHQD